MNGLSSDQRYTPYGVGARHSNQKPLSGSSYNGQVAPPSYYARKHPYSALPPSIGANILKDTYYAGALHNHAVSANLIGAGSGSHTVKNKSAILSHLNLNNKAREELEKRKLKAKQEKEKETG
jgi:hypothetical protein